MPRTAQEWKNALGLAELPDTDYLAALADLEDLETVNDTGLEAPRFQSASPESLVTALIVQGAGQAFRAVRGRAGLTTRQAGEVLGVSGARVSQIEADEANLYTTTVAEVAARFGYRATLVLEPLEGGPRIEAQLQAKEAGLSRTHVTHIGSGT
jgi:DNA-binding XRE family transcriptional regulator